MKEHLAYTGKLTGIATKSFIKINLLATVSTIITGIIGIILLLRSVDVGQSAHVSGIPFLINLFTQRPFGAFLYIVNLSVIPIVIFFLGNKYILTKISHTLVNDKGENYIKATLDKIFAKAQDKEPTILQHGTDVAITKLKVIQEVKNDTSQNKWFRKALAFAMKKVQLDDIDFSIGRHTITDVIKVRTFEKLQMMTTPSKSPIYILLGLQWFFLFIIWLTRL